MERKWKGISMVLKGGAAIGLALALTTGGFVHLMSYAQEELPQTEETRENSGNQKDGENIVYRACEHRDSYLLQDDSYEATDTEGGYRHYICSDCGAEYAYETAPLVYETNPVTGEVVTQQGASNPLYENWSFCPDGEPHVFWSRSDEEWRVYVYGSHDLGGVNMCDYDYVLWSAPVYDMASWRYEGVILDFQNLEKAGKLCAPDCDYDVTTDTYYLISNQAQPDNKSVIRAADNPVGPWNPDESVLELRMRLAYDPAIYVEDGIIYVAGVAMKSGIEDGGRADIVEAFEKDNYKAKHALSITRLKGSLQEGWEVDETIFPASDDNIYLPIYEGPSFGGWVEEIGAYVMLYVSNEPSTEGGTYHSAISYVYAEDLMSDIWHYGDNGVEDTIPYEGEELLSGNHGNVLYDTSGRYHKNPATGEFWFSDLPTYMHGNNHGGMARINGKWYEFGHRPIDREGASRQGVAGIMDISLKDDGTPLIRPVEYTSCGVSEYLDAFCVWNANTACYLIPGIGQAAPEGGEGQAAAEDFDAPYIVSIRDPEATHASYIADLKDGNVAGYKYIGFEESAARQFSMLVYRDTGAADGLVSIYLDAPDEVDGGTFIGSVEVTDETYEAGETVTASDGSVWHWISGDLTKNVAGIHALYLVFSEEDKGAESSADGAGASDGTICRFDQFTFR